MNSRRRVNSAVGCLMTSLLHCLMVAILSIVLSSFVTVWAQTASGDQLKPYTSCKVPGDLKIKEVTRRKEPNAFREVVTDKGKQNVSVIDGYRVMFAYSDLNYYFTNVKIEQSASDSYFPDKEILVDQLKHYTTTKEATAMVFLDKSPLNGFEHYGMARSTQPLGRT